jgi:hypothetical protein
MKVQACVFLFGAALVAACSGGSGSSPSSTSNDSTGGSCQSPSDCTGLLPRNEIGCADGTFAGAQWDCDSNVCTLSYCDSHGGTASNPNCSTAVFQSCNTPSDCTGSLPSGSSWGCTNDTPLSACNFAEPVCVVVQGSTNPPPSGGNGSCNSPSDCSGALPRNEIQCADGTFSGAQWDCDSNVCTISYCDNDGGPASSGGGGTGGSGGGDDAGADSGDAG